MSEVPLRPQERRRAFQLLRGYLPSLGSRLGSYTTFLDGVLRDSEVDLVLELHQGGMSMRRIAEKFDVSKSCIGHICSGRRRS